MMERQQCLILRLSVLRSRGRRAARGAVLLEMVFCVTLFLILLAGLIQYGMILHTMTTLDQYAREGARYTAENWSNIGFNNSSSTTSGTFQNYMSGMATSKNIPYSKVTANVYVPNSSGTLVQISNSTCTSNCTEITKGTLCTVQVSYDMTQQYVFYGLVPGMSKSWTYTASFTMVAE